MDAALGAKKRGVVLQARTRCIDKIAHVGVLVAYGTKDFFSRYDTKEF